MSVGIALSLIPSNVPGSLSIFFTYSLLAVTHLFASYRALSNVQFKTFNEQRFYLLMQRYLQDGQVSSPEQVRQMESVILPYATDLSQPIHLSWLSKLKALSKSIMTRKPSFVTFGSSIMDACASSDQLRQLITLFQCEKYLLNVHNNHLHVVINTEATPTDNLRAYFHAIKLQKQLESTKDWTENHELIQETLEWTNKHFDGFVQQLETHGWDYQTLHFSYKTRLTAKWNVGKIADS